MDKKVLINQPLKTSSKIRAFYGATDDNTSENSTEESCELNDLGHGNNGGQKYHRSSIFNTTSGINGRNNDTNDHDVIVDDDDDDDETIGCKMKLYQMNFNVKKLLVKYWIWLIAITLMAMSITGNKVVVFRIFYMFLFLGFLVTFQLSYNLWRRFLLPFLITVMIYSTLVLLAVYTYQFSTIRPLWKQYLYLDEKWQKDLGLELYPDPWSLFKELVKPAIFILITLIHLKSFHKDFMDLTRLDDGQNTSSSRISESGTRRTTLPTLMEESDNIHSSSNVHQRVATSISGVHRSFSSEATTATTSASQRSEGGKRKSRDYLSNHGDALPVISSGKFETLINMTDGIGSIDTSNYIDDQLQQHEQNHNHHSQQQQQHHNQMSPPVSPSQRSISFSLNDSRHPLSGFNNITKSHSNILRSISHRSTISGESITISPSKLHRRKTIVDMTQGKPLANNLKTAATDIRDRATSLWDSAKPGINELYEVIWRLVELHMMKIIYLTTFAIALSEITAVNFIYVVASSIALPLGRYERLVTIIFSIWSVILILSKMLYQLSVAEYFQSNSNCSYVYFAPHDVYNSSIEVYDYTPFNNVTLLDYRTYIGFKQVDDIFIYIGKYLIILLILTINSVITLRQQIHRKRYGVDTNEEKILFFTIQRSDADRNFVYLTKFLFNYGFYKFGLEMCIFSMIILIGNRMDLLSLIYALFVMCWSLLRRSTVAKLWPFFTIAIMISIPLQYLLSLGIPSVLCIEYPWYRAIDPQIRLWLYLPDYRFPPPGYLIMYDFIVLLLASRQWIVFRLECNSEITSKAGSNVESYYCPPEARITVPNCNLRNRDNLLDFFTFQKSFLDRIKSWFFTCFYWITLYIVFYTAYGRTNLFGLGYILGCFFFLWNGSEFYLKPINKIVRAWKFMIAYCASVIALKTMLHVIGCVLSSVLFNKFCWVAKLLGISCSSKLCRSGYDIRTEDLINQNCTFTDSTSGLLLDGVCFVFLLIQKRIFGSFYFTYLVKEIKAQQVLASRGAELIHEIQAKEVMEQEEAEKDVMEKIKTKMDRIRAYQQSIKAGDKSRLPPERKSHRQEVSDFGGISPYSTAEDASLGGHSPAPGADDASLLPSTLPTVYSPTPSLPTILSPSSAASAAYGKGYLELDRLPNIRHIDDLCSSPPTMPSMSFASSPILEADETSSMPHQFNFVSTTTDPPRHITIDPSHAILSRSSFKLHQKPLAPLTRLHSIIRKQSTHSTAASHGSVRSGDYYLFDDPETEDAEIDFEEKPRKSLIPDPEGEELRRIANLRGISAFMNQLLKGELDPEPIDPPLVADEYDLDIGESSKDSAIISIDREKVMHVDADESMETLITTIGQDEPKPSTSTASDDVMSKDTSIRRSSRKSSKRKSSTKATKRADGDPALIKKEEYEEVASSQQQDQDAQQSQQQQLQQQQSMNQSQLSLWVRVIHWLTLFYWFIESCVISATAKLNNVSRDYRYVSRRLEVEKRALKALFEMEESVGIVHDNDWKRSTLEKISKASVPPRNGSLDSIKKYSKEISLKQQTAKLKHTMEIEKQLSNDEVDAESSADDSSTLVSSNALVRLFRSLWYTALSQSEKVCYATIIFNQMINASPLSLPLPIMVFLWGCMSVPRPSKTFWISLITYTEGVVVAKYIYNFAVWPMLDFSRVQPILVQSDDSVKSGQTITQATTADLLLLLVLFFHRMMLKSLGLWDLDDSVDRDLRAATAAAAAGGGTNSLDKSFNDDSGSTIIPVTSVMPSTSNKQATRLPPVMRRRKVQKDSSANDLLNGAGGDDNINDIQQVNENTEEVTSSKTSAGGGGRIESLTNNSCSTTSYTELKTNDDNNIQRNKLLIFLSLTSMKINVGLKPIHKFYYRLLHPPFRIRHDLYSYMFLCDFINFFIVVMAFNSFGSSTGESITKYFEDNKVPMPFLFMIMAQFVSMIIDRSLYLRKNIKLRLYFHIALVFIIHFWLFFSLPSFTERPFQELGPPKWWYIFKCIYLILSAVQVRGGYPTRILGNTFTKKYSYFNLYLFKGYMLVPFLYDMRLIMDWIWTDTSLELDEWSIMEDIFKNLFQRKCELQFQANFPMFRGFPRQMYTKYLLGGAYLAMIIAAIWFPLVLFAVGGRVGTPNRPIDVVVEMEISGYVPLAKLTATKVNETYLSAEQFDSLRLAYSNKKEATTFLDSYYAEDTTIVKLNGNSTPVWGISPPSKLALIKDLKESSTAMDFRISWKISRHKASKGQVMDLEVAKTYYTHLSDATRADLVSVLNDSDTTTNAVTIPRIFPNFLRVPEKSEPEIIPQLQRDDDGYRNISLILKQNGTTQWFEVKDICTPDNDPYVNFYRKKANCDHILLMLINERVFPGALQVVSGYGILGLYTTFVFVVSRLIRSLFDDVSFKVIYTQMPNVDKVLQLCLDIYLVRESREFTLEEDLYAKLLFLYRSPETLIKWTKQLEEDQFDKQTVPPAIRDQ